MGVASPSSLLLSWLKISFAKVGGQPRLQGPLPLLKVSAAARPQRSPVPKRGLRLRFQSSSSPPRVSLPESSDSQEFLLVQGNWPAVPLGAEEVKPGRPRNLAFLHRHASGSDEGYSSTHNSCGSSALLCGNPGAFSALGLQLESVAAWEM